MTLRDVFGEAAAGAPAVDVTALALDNRRVEPGSVFFCVRGFTRDGHEFAADAVERGAVALVVDHPLDLGVPEIVVDDVRAAMAPAAARLQGDPTAELRVVGVTGTNGKTTTAYLVRALLEAAGEPTGLLGTVKSVVGGVEHEVARTTPEAIDLQAAFAAMRDAGDTHCVMEVSSHALALGRADAIHWAAAIFTNLTQDHLDFHPTMEDYYLAKRRLFDAGPKVAVVNIDDPYGARLAGELRDSERVVTFGIEAADADLCATDLRSDFAGSTFCAGGLELRSPLPGRFNVYNVLGAVAAVRALGIDDDTIVAALPTVEPRARALRAGRRGAGVRGARGLRPHPRFAGERARRRAPADARAAAVRVRMRRRPRSRQAPADGGDLRAAWPTTRSSPPTTRAPSEPEAIVDEIMAGIDDRCASEAIVDRRSAIERAVALAEPGDVVVVAGKGHEQGQELKDGHKLPFDDVTVAREALRARLVA